MDFLTRVNIENLKKINGGYLRRVMITRDKQDVFCIEEKFEDGEGYGFHVIGNKNRYDFENLHQLHNYLKKKV